MHTLQALRPHQRAEAAIKQIAAGRAVVVTGDGLGQLVFAAELATPPLMAFLVRHCSGFVCLALPESECERLRLPPMYYTGSSHAAAFRVTVDAAEGVGTGISARDRAHTARLLANASSSYSAFTRPGHMVPVATHPDGVLDRCGPAEAAVDLARLAGLRPAGVLCGIVSVLRPTEMAQGPELAEFAAIHGLARVSVADLAAYRCRTEPEVEWATVNRLATPA